MPLVERRALAIEQKRERKVGETARVEVSLVATEVVAPSGRNRGSRPVHLGVAIVRAARPQRANVPSNKSWLSIVLSGMRPTGQLHLGNYHGALKNWIELQFLVDLRIFIGKQR